MQGREKVRSGKVREKGVSGGLDIVINNKSYGTNNPIGRGIKIGRGEGGHKQQGEEKGSPSQSVAGNDGEGIGAYEWWGGIETMKRGVLLARG